MRFYHLPILVLLSTLPLVSLGRAAELSGSVSFAITINAPPEANKVKLWFPYPVSDLEQSIENLRFDGNYSSFSLAREPKSGALYLYTNWHGPMSRRTMTVTFDARTSERKVNKLIETTTPFPPEVKKYLEAEFWLPSDDPKIQSLAHEIVRNHKGVLAKARAIYDWTVENTQRDPNVPGCGIGDVEATLAARTGKCADISSVFVALARAAGVPAREVFGLRLGRPGQTDISNGHHCWVEFYLPGTGWVPADPADVLSNMQLYKLNLATAKRFREYYFGAVDEYRIALQRGGRGLSFAEGNVVAVNYFMYPYAEVDGRPLDYCKSNTFAYTVTFNKSGR